MACSNRALSPSRKFPLQSEQLKGSHGLQQPLSLSLSHAKNSFPERNLFMKGQSWPAAAAGAGEHDAEESEGEEHRYELRRESEIQDERKPKLFLFVR